MMDNDQKTAIDCIVLAEKMEFWKRIDGVSQVNKIFTSKTGTCFNIELQLVSIERFQRHWFGHVSGKRRERLTGQILLPQQAKKDRVAFQSID